MAKKKKAIEDLLAVMARLRAPDGCPWDQKQNHKSIRLNAIAPGWIVTDATAPAVENEAFSNLITKRIPARRWGTPNELEGVAVYLASDASGYHTGDTLRVDGGYAIF